MDFIALGQRLAGIGMPAVNDQQHRLWLGIDLKTRKQVAQRASGRQRHLKTSQCPRRRSPLERRVQMNGDYQLKMLSRSDSDAS